MNAIVEVAGQNPEAKAEFQEACDKLEGGAAFTTEERLAARKRMDKIREENRKLFGESNIAVELIREARDNK